MRNLKFTFIFFVLSLLLVSCGADKLSSNKAVTPKTTSALGGGKECACNTGDTIPVCGFNGNTNVTYLNACVAQCYGVTQHVQGECVCQYDKEVCGDDGQTYPDECSAQAAIRNGFMKKFVHYGRCNK